MFNVNSRVICLILSLHALNAAPLEYDGHETLSGTLIARDERRAAESGQTYNSDSPISVPSFSDPQGWLLSLLPDAQTKAKWSEYFNRQLEAGQNIMTQMFNQGMQGANQVKQRLQETGEYATATASEYAKRARETVDSNLAYAQQELAKQAQQVKGQVTSGIRSTAAGVSELGQYRRRGLEKLATMSTTGVQKMNEGLDNLNGYYRNQLHELASRIEAPTSEINADALAYESANAEVIPDLQRRL